MSSDRSIFDLENSVDLAKLSEPLTALEHLRGLIVIDEVQRRPDLFRVLRVLLDRKPLRACEALELCKRMHNPKAEVVYDVLAGREGGAKLYSQIAPLFTDTQNSDYAPTQEIGRSMCYQSGQFYLLLTAALGLAELGLAPPRLVNDPSRSPMRLMTV